MFELLYKDGKVIRGWQKKAKELGLTVDGLSTQDIWDRCQDSIMCPVCNVRERKIKQTNVGRTQTCGDSNCANKHKHEKTKTTCQERYGVNSPMQHDAIKTKQTRAFAEKYGVHPTKLKETQNKRKRTNLKKYGCATPAMGDELKQQSVESYKINRRKNYVQEIWPKRKLSIFETLGIEALSDWNGADEKIKWRHSCGHEWMAPIPDGSLPWCPACGLSKEQFGIEKFISDCGVHVIRNDRKTIAPYELDIYIPELRLAVEMNGWYWHKDGLSTPMLTKTKLCGELGIRVIHIMDWEWNQNQELIKSYLRHALGMSTNKINARECVVRTVESRVANLFLTQNHIGGFQPAQRHYGLFQNTELVGVMSVGNPRWSEHDLEIIRWATKSNSSVMGGFSKVLSRIKIDMDPQTILSYCDLRWGTGEVYRKAGFLFIGNTKPNYWWVNGRKILSRYQTQKHNLTHVLGETFREDMSESENMMANGWSKISDCGNGKWIWKKGA